MIAGKPQSPCESESRRTGFFDVVNLVGGPGRPFYGLKPPVERTPDGCAFCKHFDMLPARTPPTLTAVVGPHGLTQDASGRPLPGFGPSADPEASTGRRRLPGAKGRPDD